jgi:hypothetical protein
MILNALRRPPARLGAFFIVAMGLRGAVMVARKSGRLKIAADSSRVFTLARVVVGSVLDSAWDFPTQTDMVLLTFAEAVVAVHLFSTLK